MELLYQFLEPATSMVGITVVNFVYKLIITALIIFVGFYLVKKLVKIIEKSISKIIDDKTFVKFITNLSTYVLYAIVLLMAISNLGIETASIVALVGAIGFAIGLAFQGALSNFAGGILLVVLRPFAVGDFVEVEGIKGVVEELAILTTTIISVDNKVITIPNGKLSNGNIINYSTKETRRVDIDFHVGYGENTENVIKIIRSVIDSCELILDDKDIFVEITSMSNSSIIYTTRVWSKSEDYWNVYFYLLKNMKITFDKENIEIPYQKIDINLIK